MTREPALLAIARHWGRVAATVLPMLATSASDHVIDTAYAWLCLRRKNWPANSDVWALRFCWSAEKVRLREALLTGRYCFEPMQRVTKADGVRWCIFGRPATRWC